MELSHPSGRGLWKFTHDDGGSDLVTGHTAFEAWSENYAALKERFGGEHHFTDFTCELVQDEAPQVARRARA